jgi:replicative DNA helicase
MSREELVDRLLVGQADIDAWKLKTGRLSQEDFLKISDAMGVLAESKLFIDDTPGLSIYEMRTKARRLMMEQEIDLLVVDYLQLAHGQNRENRVQEVGEISQGLKNIARELKIPVLALAQLSRAVEQRGEKAPQLSDLRESGSIEQDADVVMFLYRKDVIYANPSHFALLNTEMGVRGYRTIL